MIVDADIVGMGLASPIGWSTEEHVFFLRAGEPPPRGSPFTSDGEPLRVAYCPLLGAREAVAPRCAAMATAALDEALSGVPPLDGGYPLYVITPDDRPGFQGADRQWIERALGRRTGAKDVIGRRGAAAAFTTLGEMGERVASGGARVAVLVAVDSFIAVEALADPANRPHPWQPTVYTPGEGAAAIVVAAKDLLPAIPAIATVKAVAAESGKATDENDEVVDGVAMTRALRALPSYGTIGTVCGQLHVDALRTREWSYALARNATMFESEHEAFTLEDEAGRLGAAAGAMSLVYGIALHRHRATRALGAPGRPVLAWNVARDGTRSVALATVPADA